MKFLTPVVLAGGVGSRLWLGLVLRFPSSTRNLIDNEHIPVAANLCQIIWPGIGLSQVICNQEHRFLAAE